MGKGESDSQYFKGLRRGVLRAILGPQSRKRGVFSDRSLSRLNFLFSLDFLRNDIFSRHELYKGGAAGEVRYRVSFRINPCVERASACQARACIGAEGFIHSEESVESTEPKQVYSGS